MCVCVFVCVCVCVCMWAHWVKEVFILNTVQTVSLVANYPVRGSALRPDFTVHESMSAEVILEQSARNVQTTHTHTHCYICVLMDEADTCSRSTV